MFFEVSFAYASTGSQPSVLGMPKRLCGANPSMPPQEPPYLFENDISYAESFPPFELAAPERIFGRNRYLPKTSDSAGPVCSFMAKRWLNSGTIKTNRATLCWGYRYVGTTSTLRKLGLVCCIVGLWSINRETTILGTAIYKKREEIGTPQRAETNGRTHLDDIKGTEKI